jgi:ribose-phosphate pyrophosphokinase
VHLLNDELWAAVVAAAGRMESGGRKGLPMTDLRIVSGSANPGLASAVANHLGVEPDGCSLERYTDGELRPTIKNGCGADVYVFQPTTPPVNDHIIELLLLLDACRRARAARVTAVVPYFGYARQDHRTAPGQALGATVVAATIAAAGADRLVVVDPHKPPFRVYLLAHSWRHLCGGLRPNPIFLRRAASGG